MYSKIAKNARLGDGCISTSGVNSHLSFMSTDIEVLKLKKKMCDEDGFVTRPFGTQSSGYGGTKTIYNFYSRVDKEITKVHKASIEDLVLTLDKEDLFLWIIDDGSWHKSQNLFHLYCNMFTDSQAELLMDKITELYGVRPRLRKDRKRDGREFNYLYFPRQLTILLRPEFKEYLIDKGLASMYYKFGGMNYSDPFERLSRETIKSTCYPTIVKKYAAARGNDKEAKINEFDEFIRVSWQYKGEPRERIINKEAV